MLKAQSLSKTYVTHAKKEVLAVQDVSLHVEKGKTLGLVGESGCGKSTLSRMLMLLEAPSSGEIFFENKPIRMSDRVRVRDFRRQVQIIFQNPMNALNPRMAVSDILKEPFQIHKEKYTESTIEALLTEVGLQPDKKSRKPHELSGGERQRICIARALALKPKVIICDESVSSLDVLIRAQILNLFLDLQKKHDLSYLFISHDLRVIRHMSDSIAVMQQGRIVESGSRDSILKSPKNAYTQTLLCANDLSDIATY